MYSSYVAALDQLSALRASGNLNEDTLRNLIASLDVSAEGSVTVLYAGKVDGVNSIDVAREIANDPSIRIIDKTEAAKFLDIDKNPAFREALEEVFKSDPTQRGSKANAFLFGERDIASGARTPNGAWDIVSGKFASATTGRVKILTESPGAFSVLLQTEIPKLLAKFEAGTDITEIAGFTREKAIGFSSVGELRNAILTRAAQETILSKPSLGNYSSFLNMTDDMFTTAWKSASGDQLSGMTKAVQEFKMGTAAVKLLPKLGVGFALMGGLVVSAQAAEAYAEGRPDEANHLLEDYAAESAGSTVAQAAAGIMATAGLVLMGVAAATPIGIATILIATVVGGYFGGEKGKELIHLFQDRSEEKARDIAQRMLKLIYGDNYSLDMPIPQDLLTSGTLNLDTTWSREKIVANARADIAWRYTLRELNPFVLSGIDYAKHNLDGSLDLFDPATGKGAMSDLYLEDRAAMLTWKLRYDAESKPYGEQYSTSEINGNWDFVDHKNNITLAIDGNGLSLSDHQIVFGTQKDELISGSGVEDHLYGMGGNDRLVGGSGDDEYRVYDTDDVVHEAKDAGKDTVYTRADYTLSDNVEDLVLTAGNINSVGNNLDNKLTGNAGDNKLEGAEGDDTLMGGAGNDIYLYDRGSGRDVIEDRDTTPWNIDTVRMGAGIRPADVYATQEGNDLVLLLDNPRDRLTARNWFSGNTRLHSRGSRRSSSWGTRLNQLLLTLIAVIGLTGALWPLTGLAAGFDCAKAGTSVERMICADPQLLELDEQLTTAYASAKAQAGVDVPALTKAQRQWLKERNACADKGCVAQRYQERITALDCQGSRIFPCADPAAPAPSAVVQPKAAPANIAPLPAATAPAKQRPTRRSDQGHAPDPARYRQESQVLEKLKQTFLQHIDRATNVSVPYVPEEFPWKIDWKRQQAYCKSLWQALTSERAQRVKFFEEPTGSVYRDGEDAYAKAWRSLDYPQGCREEFPRRYPGIYVENRGYRFYDHSPNWVAEIVTSLNALNKNADFLDVDLTRLIHGKVKDGKVQDCNVAGITGHSQAGQIRGRPLAKGGFENIVLQIDEAPVLLTFGRYVKEMMPSELEATGYSSANLRRGESEKSYFANFGKRYGHVGQGFVAVQSYDANLYRTLALERNDYEEALDGVLSGSFPHKAPSLEWEFLVDYEKYTCIINFNLK